MATQARHLLQFGVLLFLLGLLIGVAIFKCDRAYENGY